MWYWNNDLRCSIIINDFVVDKLDDDPDLLLEVDSEVRFGPLGYYTRIELSEYIDPEPEGEYEHYPYHLSYDQYTGAYGLDDQTINSVFDGDPENYWNID